MTEILKGGDDEPDFDHDQLEVVPIVMPGVVHISCPYAAAQDCDTGGDQYIGRKCPTPGGPESANRIVMFQVVVRGLCLIPWLSVERNAWG